MTTPHEEQTAEPILVVSGLKKYFPVERGVFRRVAGHVKAVDDVSFSVMPGETMGLVGESGCGKTTTARVVLRALEPTDGAVTFRPGDGVAVDMARLDKAGLKAVRRHMQMIFQDPYSSLNPRMPVFDIVSEPLRAHGWTRKQCEERAAEILELVGLDPHFMRRYPHAFSGGQRQRIGIARALALSPSLVVADEPVSALDVSVQAQILNLLEEMQEKMHLTYVLIAHDLSVVRYVCDRVAVMYLGKLVEVAETEALFTNPRHPYTSALLSAVPDIDPAREWLADTLAGEATAPAGDATGCAFAPRCRYAVDVCREEAPALRVASGSAEKGTRRGEEKAQAGDGRDGSGGSHRAACHRSGEIELEGV